MQKEKTTRVKKLLQTEHELHIECVKYFNTFFKGGIINHQANENPRGDKKQMIRYNVKMRSLGTKAGFPDIQIIFNGQVLFIEFKSLSGSLSENQKKLFAEFEEQGFKVHIVKTLNEFIDVLNNFKLVNKILTKATTSKQ